MIVAPIVGQGTQVSTDEKLKNTLELTDSPRMGQLERE